MNEDDFATMMARVLTLERIVLGFVGGNVEPDHFDTFVDVEKQAVARDPSVHEAVRAKLMVQMDGWKEAVRAKAATREG